jgi:hypothetical protein
MKRIRYTILNSKRYNFYAKTGVCQNRSLLRLTLRKMWNLSHFVYRQQIGDVSKIHALSYYYRVNVSTSSHVNPLSIQENFSSRLMYSAKELVKKLEF